VNAPIPHVVTTARVELVIFDCDGVLVDSEQLACSVHARMLASAGIVVSPEQIQRRFTGSTDRAMYAALEEELGRPLPAGHAELTAAEMRAAFQRELSPVRGVADALARMSLAKCVASNSGLATLRLGLTVTGLIGHFAPNIFSAQMVERGKPAPDLFLYAARQMGVAPAHCLVVEDSVHGVNAARAAGMRVLGFCGGSHCAPGHDAALTAAGATLTFGDMTELPALVVA
jgi:HAD superfamily hydrolase (TIGR01509 family)